MDLPEPPRSAELEIMRNDPFGPSAYGKVSRPGYGLILALVALAWVIEIVDRVFGFVGLPLDTLGIWPRKLSGLPGILLSPWLHGGWAHLMGNTLTFLVLGFVMMVAEGRRFLLTSFWLVLLSGGGTWLIGRGGSVHIGASGLIYGYFGYLLLRAWTERKPIWVVVGILIAVFYGGMLWGVFPTDHGISWEGHLCGFLGGLWLGRSHGLQGRAKGEGAL